MLRIQKKKASKITVHVHFSHSIYLHSFFFIRWNKEISSQIIIFFKSIETNILQYYLLLFSTLLMYIFLGKYSTLPFFSFLFLQYEMKDFLNFFNYIFWNYGNIQSYATLHSNKYKKLWALILRTRNEEKGMKWEFIEKLWIIIISVWLRKEN